MLRLRFIEVVCRVTSLCDFTQKWQQWHSESNCLDRLDMSGNLQPSHTHTKSVLRLRTVFSGTEVTEPPACHVRPGLFIEFYHPSMCTRLVWNLQKVPRSLSTCTHNRVWTYKPLVEHFPGQSIQTTISVPEPSSPRRSHSISARSWLSRIKPGFFSMWKPHILILNISIWWSLQTMQNVLIA